MAVNHPVSPHSNNQICNRLTKFEFFIVDGDPEAEAKSLRNQFNYQERTSQTFNYQLREKGRKTNPPLTSKFVSEMTQWMVFDAYMEQYEADRRREEEESAKAKNKDKKPQQVV